MISRRDAAIAAAYFRCLRYLRRCRRRHCAADADIDTLIAAALMPRAQRECARCAPALARRIRYIFDASCCRRRCCH